MVRTTQLGVSRLQTITKIVGGYRRCSTQTGYLATKHMMMPKDENFMGDIFGGHILGEMDLAAAIAARRVVKTRVVTVALDKVLFKNSVHTGDTLSCYTWIDKVGTTSIGVKVLAKVHRLDSDEDEDAEEEVTEGHFTFVCVDSDGKPVPHGQSLPAPA